MLQFNLLKWCDDKYTYLKENNILFENDIPQLPERFVYTELPKNVSTFAYRRDIPTNDQKNSLLLFFMFEDKLWPRLYKIDSDMEIMKNYGGISGFDLSPSVNMLRPRQKLSIMINAIYSCYCGLQGIKILPNYRSGDIGTICAADYFPDGCNFIVGNHGCNNHGYKDYGAYIQKIIVRKKRPTYLFVYGAISKQDAFELISKYGVEIITFPDRRNRVRNNSKSYHCYVSDKKLYREEYTDWLKGGVA